MGQEGAGWVKKEHGWVKKEQEEVTEEGKNTQNIPYIHRGAEEVASVEGGLKVEGQVVTRRRSPEAAMTQGSLPPRLSPQVSAEPNNTGSPSNKAPVLEREDVKEGRGDAQESSSSNEDNNDGFESHENGDSSADEALLRRRAEVKSPAPRRCCPGVGKYQPGPSSDQQSPSR